MHSSAVQAFRADSDAEFSGASAHGTLDKLCAALQIDGALLLDLAGALVVSGGPVNPDAILEYPELSGWTSVIRAVSDVGQAQIGFMASVPVPDRRGQPSYTLVLWDSRPRNEARAYWLLALVVQLVNQAAISRLHRFHEQNRFMFERASQTAHIGVWVCSLPDKHLTWTDGIYDLFELPRGAPLDRDQTAQCYTPESRQRMETARSRAIAEHGQFSLDAEIITAKGNRRWMRLTGAVECENGVARRIFGMKQDITEEKLLADRTRYLAEFDLMTGLANRSQFQSRIGDIAGLSGSMPVGGLLVIDIDRFKQINDTHGHAAGDDYLKEASRRLVDCFASAELVARIGGDEFAVLLGTNVPASEIERQAAAAVRSLAADAVIGGSTVGMSISIGVAHCRSTSGEDLFRQADVALYAAKAAGRNTHRVFGK